MIFKYEDEGSSYWVLLDYCRNISKASLIHIPHNFITQRITRRKKKTLSFMCENFRREEK